MISMTIIYFLLLLAAFACFLFEAFSRTKPARPLLIALGLAFWVAVPLLQTVRAL